ncbi:MAG TPA: hypothetical protein VL551_05370 [Actinospica sp.]|nr:hypothetical protein [Actinospica sp.]
MREVPRTLVPDSWRRHGVHPREIRPGDWLRDLGTLRQVETVEQSACALTHDRIVVVRFVPQSGVEDLALSLPGTVTAVTVWREPQAGLGSHAAAAP